METLAHNSLVQMDPKYMSSPFTKLVGGWDSPTATWPVFGSSVSGSEFFDGTTDPARTIEKGLRGMRERLTGWLRDPSTLEDDDLDAPTAKTIRLALDLVRRLDVATMDRVAPPDVILLIPRGAAIAGDGGISLEFSNGRLGMTLQIRSDGTVTRMVFVNDRLMSRRQLPLLAATT